jgi:hypothetical protein
MAWWKRKRKLQASISAGQELLARAPGPTPWYLQSAPAVQGFAWARAGDSGDTAGAVVLRAHEEIVLILDFHNYTLLIDPDTLLVWHQPYDDSGLTTLPVVLRTFVLPQLRPLKGDLAELCREMRRSKAPFASSDPPAWQMSLPTTVVGSRQYVSFPAPLRSFAELLILCHSSAVKTGPPPDSSNLALMVVSPREGCYELFPQDWFNSAGLDYGYQWVTRVARDPRTGRIHGEGIRIDPFILDDTWRHAL